MQGQHGVVTTAAHHSSLCFILIRQRDPEGPMGRGQRSPVLSLEALQEHGLSTSTCHGQGPGHLDTKGLGQEAHSCDLSGHRPPGVFSLLMLPGKAPQNHSSP